eukprot:CAMPEP_0171500856 /NCGR_PEP_ID=MMETSP0958-20121227/9229_1 /TAXON_ID=87120 /ORGANISM="Aurantiochytrium limacinum, Strain ATCCMYA-1381" /LENGTH=238 /DNA_ID=CAMNT_0012035595 /DNA_START=184 /DNA_END=900 /DNA_ORIENTATION=-
MHFSVAFALLQLLALAMTSNAASLRSNEQDVQSVESKPSTEFSTIERSLTQAEAITDTCEAFELIGDGFCRETEAGTGTGKFNLYNNIYSQEDCEKLCRDYEGCTGYEYDEREHRHTCEVHRGSVEGYAAKDGVKCYKLKKNPYRIYAKGYCRWNYSDSGAPVPHNKEDIGVFCNDKHPCTLAHCAAECEYLDWCKHFEFKPKENPYYTDIVGQCTHFKKDVTAYKASKYATCYETCV